MSRGERTEQFAAEIAARGLSYDDVQALWHATSWHLIHEATSNDAETLKHRMHVALERMPVRSKA